MTYSATHRIIQAICAGLLLYAAPAYAQRKATDPGVRAGVASGGPVSGLDALQQSYFTSAQQRFQEIDSVTGTIAGETGNGLGPRFNGNGCSGCHAYPALGGSSPPQNIQPTLATLDGATNSVPPFITANGPTREARFLRNADGSADGSVHQLFVITGRSDAGPCAITQPDFATAIAKNNIAYRIPTPLFGLGLIEATPDANLLATFNNSAALRTQLNIAGHFNHSANDATITRFGWKAQNKSLLMFAGEAYNVEQGVTNELFPNETATAPGCPSTGTPEDYTNLTNTLNSGSPASDYAADIVNFAAFIRLLAPPASMALTQTTQQGQQVFMMAGCQACHAPTQQTGLSSITALNQVSYAPFSDFALHHMGTGLADGIAQGQAATDEFRTAPLWGLGQRIFFLHDGRTSDLNQAILAHASTGSEANMVIHNYQNLQPPLQQALLDYLRSL